MLKTDPVGSPLNPFKTRVRVLIHIFVRTIICSLESHRHQHLRTGREWSFKDCVLLAISPTPGYACSTHPAQGCMLPFREILTLEDLHNCMSSRTKREQGFQARTLPANLSTLIICHWDGNALLYYASFFPSISFHFFLTFVLNFLSIGRAQQQKVKAKIILSGFCFSKSYP